MALSLALHLSTTSGYGYFRDELYYVANGEHLSFGYVDHPPLIGLVAAMVTSTLGTSLFALRLLPALASAVHLWLTAAIAKELGGGKLAQNVSCLAALWTPIYLSLFSFLSMNAFDLLFWAWALWIVTRVTQPGENRGWLVFGVVMGFGLENKLSLLLLWLALGASLLSFRRWKHLFARDFWLGGVLSIVLLLPYVAWQWHNDWPLWQFMQNARAHKNAELSAASFFSEQWIMIGPHNALLWLWGLYWLLSRPATRVLGGIYLWLLATLLWLGGAKPYYLAPVYVLLLAAGGVALEAATERRWRWLRVIAVLVVLVGGAVTLPLAKPVISADRYVSYAQALGFVPTAIEQHERSRLPQFYADMHGWESLAQATAQVYRGLSEEEQAVACVFGQNYGEAGAIDLFGPNLGLPPAISGHNSYWYWGPGSCTGEVLIVLGDGREDLEELFEQVQLGSRHDCRDCMPYENNLPIWVARKLKVPIAELWPKIRRLM